MDAFKAAEIERMRLGGNENWRRFFEEHPDTRMRGLSWDDATIAERYGGEVGEEWKERLSAKVEGREYVPGEKPAAAGAGGAGSVSASPAPSAGAAVPTRSGPGAGTPVLGGSRNASPGPGKIKVDVDYFAKLGERNAQRPDDLPPSQGGKYSGFGSSAPRPQREEQALPGLDDLQKDPVAAITKGFGWFASTVTKTAKTVNEGFIQPTAKQVRFSRAHNLDTGVTLLTRLSRYPNPTLQPRPATLPPKQLARHRRAQRRRRKDSTASSRARRAVVTSR
jgi:ADP-ribosylation factor GTPase-activating protein 1